MHGAEEAIKVSLRPCLLGAYAIFTVNVLYRSREVSLSDYNHLVSLPNDLMVRSLDMAPKTVIILVIYEVVLANN